LSVQTEAVVSVLRRGLFLGLPVQALVRIVSTSHARSLPVALVNFLVSVGGVLYRFRRRSLPGATLMPLRHWIPIAAVFPVLILDIIAVTITRHGDKIEARLREPRTGCPEPEPPIKKGRDKSPQAKIAFS